MFGILYLLITLFSKNRLQIGLAVLILVTNVLPMSVRLMDTVTVPTISAKSDTQNQLRVSVLFSNVLSSNTNHQALLDLIKREQPDIVTLTEITDEWLSDLHVMEAEYPYAYKHPRKDNFGMAIYSKQPFDGTLQELGNYKLPAIFANFGAFKVLLVHPVPPFEASYAQENKAYLQAISNITIQETKPLIFVGDLNSTLWSQGMVPIIQSGLKRADLLGIAYTWPSQFFPLAIQIDHIFVKNITAKSFKVLPFVGSDHFPIRADVTLETK